MALRLNGSKILQADLAPQALRWKSESISGRYSCAPGPRPTGHLPFRIATGSLEPVPDQVPSIQIWSASFQVLIQGWRPSEKRQRFCLCWLTFDLKYPII